MLLGHWRSFADLEENVNLPELYLLVDTARKRQHEHNKFLAALKGVDLDKGAQTSAEEKFNEVQNRVQAKLRGVSEQSHKMDSVFGIDVETEE